MATKNHKIQRSKRALSWKVKKYYRWCRMTAKKCAEVLEQMYGEELRPC